MQARFSHRITLSEEKELLCRAQKGDWRAEMRLDEELYSGSDESDLTAEMIRLYVEHLEKRSEDWEGMASIFLGPIYSNEKWGRVDKAKAMSKYCLAWKQGELYGRECLGFEYYAGNLVEQNYKRAFELLSASDEHAESWQTKYTLGEMYLKGFYVQQNYKKALEYFYAVIHDKAEAKVLDPFFYKAYDRISEIYRLGLGVEYDYRKAEHYRNKKEHYNRQRPLVAISYLKRDKIDF